jgi:hypothetical protein
LNPKSQTRDSAGNGGKLSGGFSKCLGGPAILFSILTLAGCSTLNIPTPEKRAEVAPVELSTKPGGPLTPATLQAEVLRSADTYVAMVAQSCDDLSAKTTNAAVRLAALRWKLSQATAAFNDATGDNPSVNALDLLVLVTMARNVVEDYGVKTYGDAALPLLDTQRKLESNAWSMAKSVLKPSQEQELKNMIQEWRQKNPDQRDVGPIRFREFAAALGRTPKQSSVAPTSIFSLLYIDPLSGLDPTTAAIEGIRELGERAMYYSQRMPMLLSWQTQLLVLQLAEQPAPQQMLNDANQLASAAAAFAQTSQQLPQLINDQRQAAIQQILDGLIAQGNKSRELVTDTRLTLNSAASAASNINNAIQSLTAFVEYVSPTNTPSAPADTNSPPFNVLDYGTAASQIGSAASNLTVLLGSANQSAPQLAKLSQQMTAEADRMVQHAFWYGLALILILLAGLVVAGLTYRVLANRLAHRGRAPSGPGP